MMKNWGQLPDTLSAGIRNAVFNAVHPFVTQGSISFRQDPANEIRARNSWRGIVQFLSEQTRSFRFWSLGSSQRTVARSHVEAFFDSVIANVDEDNRRLEQERRKQQHRARQAYSQGAGSRINDDHHYQDLLPGQRRSRFVPDRVEEPLNPPQLDIDESTWLTPQNNSESVDANEDRMDELEDPLARAQSNPRGSRGRSGNSLAHSTMTVLSSIASSNTAIDPSEREALLTVDGDNTSSMGNMYEESYIDINEQCMGLHYHVNTKGDVNV